MLPFSYLFSFLIYASRFCELMQTNMRPHKNVAIAIHKLVEANDPKKKKKNP